jgi:peroxiredoxin
LSFAKRVLLLLIAFFCIFSALSLVVTVGLPDRAVYSGLITEAGIFAPEIGFQAPLFAAERLGGESLNLFELRGSPIVINFWATWCGPCAAEMPELQALYDAQHSTGLRVLGVNVGENMDAIVTWAQEYNLTFDLLLDPQGVIADQYRLRGQPSTYVLSPDGVITNVFYGPTTRSQLEAALAPSS